MKKIKEVDKFKIAIILILIFGCAIRIIGIDQIPNGINTDEASAGYEAFSIANYGIDRNGKTLPVFLEAWGSGQNALYTYLLIPFIKIFGLTVFSIRLPMALIGCISLFVMYKLLKMQDNKKLTLVVLTFFTIAPWHIMKCRWGLESNIFPDLMLWAAYFLINGIHTQKICKFYIGTAIMGLCAYAYGTSYYFLPIFSIILLLYLVKRKQLSKKQAIISFGIIGMISLPIILMVIINTFNLPELKIFDFTIPKLEESRFQTTTIFSSDNLIFSVFENIKKGIKILFTQNDELIYNTLPSYGLIYLSSLPIIIIGIGKAIKNKNLTNTVFNIWAISSIALIPMCEPNINRLNVLIIPLIYYTGLGIFELIENYKKIVFSIMIVYLIQFAFFMDEYVKTEYTSKKTWNSNLENVSKYVNDLDVESIYFENSIKEPYIYILFYNRIDTNEFVKTVKYKNNYKDFDSVQEFGKYKFYIPQNLKDSKNTAIAIKKENEDSYNINEEVWLKHYIDDYIVLTAK